jgi:flagellar assembly protein FliH
LTGAKPPKRSAIVSAGSYRIDREARWLRAVPPAPPRDPADEEAATETWTPEPVPVFVEEPAPEPAELPPDPVELAKAEAERLLDVARQDAETVKSQAHDQGYADGIKEGVETGRQQGREEALAELRETLDRWSTMGDALTEAWRVRFQGLEDEIKDLAVAAAEKLLSAQLAVAPDTVLAVIRDALRHAAEADLVTVLVSPRDVAVVRGAKDELAGLLKGTGRFELIEDAKVEPGSCIIETKTQVIDATQATRAQKVRDAMGGTPPTKPG